METPIPTPFDIIPPPPGAWVPSPLSWGITLLLAILGGWWCSRLRRQQPAPPIQRMLQSLLADLQSTLQTSPPQLERASRIARRIVSQYSAINPKGGDLTGLSSSELRELALTLPTTTDAQAASHAELLTLIADLEDGAYAPHNAELPTTLATLGERLRLALETHLRRFPLV
jgi:hypothetical protein